jgi:hypothetical protein
MKGEIFFHHPNHLPTCNRQIFSEIPAMLQNLARFQKKLAGFSPKGFGLIRSSIINWLK